MTDSPFFTHKVGVFEELPLYVIICRMARPRRDTDPDHFTSAEMAVAAGVSARNFMLLVERGLGPEPKHLAPGRGGTRDWDTFGLSQGAILGALHKAGLGLFAAARLASVIAREQGDVYGRFISRLDRYLRDKEFNARFPNFPWYPTDESKGDARDDFWLHHYLRTKTDAYGPRTAFKGDFLLEVIDQRYVFYGALHHLQIQYADGSPAEPLCWIENWGRGEEISVRLVSDEVNPLIGKPELAADKAIRAEFMAARTNAISFLRVNMSLAIRTALDNLHDHREEREKRRLSKGRK